MKRLWSLLAVCTLILTSCADNDANSGDAGFNNTNAAPAISYNVVSTYPHDTSIYTQGFEFYKGKLFQSGGQYGSSKLALTDLTTGKIIQQLPLDKKYFGEGLTVLNDTIYQLTWQEHIVHVYHVADFKKIKELPINTDGWGLTNDGKNIIASDGSSNLYFYEPSTFRLLRTQGVTENGNPVININELEYINGFIYANQYQYNYIVKIEPNSGHVVGKLDLTEIVNRIKAKDPRAQELNGIAYNADTKKIYITGKYWPELFEVQFAL
ncbi:MAG TPA: glutaminyl-peptide cyclotransferase [Chitinophagaceae bacterium]|jgi:glutamine cyclotransferase|nr:glutaminyl-peptide cyclotransferase [Chitinophagaceae bacterium]